MTTAPFSTAPVQSPHTANAALVARAQTHALLTLTAVAAWSLAALALVIAVGIPWHAYVAAKGVALNATYFVAQSVRGVLLAGIATAVAFPLGILCALYTQVYGAYRFRRQFSLMLDLAACIPGIAWGWFVAEIALSGPFGKQPLPDAFWLAATVTLTLLPNCARRARAALRDVPGDMVDGAIALGATRWDAFVTVSLRGSRAWLQRAALRAFTRAVCESSALLLTMRLLHLTPNTLGTSLAALTLQTLSTTPGTGAIAEYTVLDRSHVAIGALLLTIFSYALRRLERDPAHVRSEGT